MTRLIYVLALTYIINTDAQVFDHHTKLDTTCNGSLVLKNTDGKETILPITETPRDVYINLAETVFILSAKVDGCGCYNLYYGKHGRRGSVTINSGQHLSKDQIELKKVRSVERVACEKNAMPVWGVIVTVIAVVALVGLITVVVVRKLRKYKEIEQNPSPMGV